jgi:hypothetical protein
VRSDAFTEFYVNPAPTPPKLDTAKPVIGLKHITPDQLCLLK